jgi:hypothetical protein
MVNRKALVLVIIVAAAGLLFGKSSKLMMSWKNPNYNPAYKFHRVLALGLSNKTEVRADFEDALAAELSSKGYEAIPGNSILLRPPGTKLDLNYLREQIRANQIEAVVVSRLIKVDDTVTYVPGTAYSRPFLTTTPSMVITVRFTRWSTRPAICRKRGRSVSKPTSIMSMARRMDS